MRIDIVSQHRLWSRPADLDAVVVIDVLRSFTTAACAITRGARAIFPAGGPAAAFALWRRRPHATLVGALGGGRPVPGFEFGNSPSEILRADLFGRDVILSTAAGVAGLLRFADVPLVLGGALCNVSATAEFLRKAAPRSVALVVTGEWTDRDGDEDIACAEALRDSLMERAFDPSAIEARVRASDFGRRFGLETAPFLPLADLECCADFDRFAFAMRLEREGVAGDFRLMAVKQRSGLDSDSNGS